VFTCSAGGYGFILVEWKRKDAKLSKNFNVTQLSLPNVTISTLTIFNVTKEDEGIYSCIAWIDKRSSESNTSILYYAGMMQLLCLHVHVMHEDIANYNAHYSRIY